MNKPSNPVAGHTPGNWEVILNDACEVCIRPALFNSECIGPVTHWPYPDEFKPIKSEFKRLLAKLDETQKALDQVPALQQSSRLPWRVVENERGFFEVWTRADDTPGSQNNYVVAGEIQFRDEAELLASAPRLARENEVLRRVLLQFADCNLHDGNCASLEVATRRIRNLARTALTTSSRPVAASEPDKQEKVP